MSAGVNRARVRVAQGELQGLTGDGVRQFCGVPYAAPPVGALRFAAPAPALCWAGVRDAQDHGPVPPQPVSRLRAVMGDFDRPQHEDCLTLTIAVPDRPCGAVIVWLHGGAYCTGAGSLDWYDGGELAARTGCVVVGVNHRLGALGFLALPGIADGLAGLRDIEAALGWVQTNIAAFGADPSRVTVVGQSAGAHAIMCMLARPRAAGLFHRAVLQSPPARIAPRSTAIAASHARLMLGAMHATPDQLATMAMPDLLAGQSHVARAVAAFADLGLPLMPVIGALADSDVFVQLAAAGAAARGIDLVIGTTRDEMHGFFVPDPAMADPPPAQVSQRFAELAGDPAALRHYAARRPGGQVVDWLADLVTDHVFQLPSLQFADACARAGAAVFVYRFDWSPPASRFGACHCIDLPLLFGNRHAWRDAPMLAGADPLVFAGLSAAIAAAWGGFARNGVPEAPKLPWPAYVSASRLTMRLDHAPGIVADLSEAGRRGGLPPAWPLRSRTAPH